MFSSLHGLFTTRNKSFVSDIGCIVSNAFARCIIEDSRGVFLDKNNIGWRIVDGEWIGKRTVWTYDFRACWLEQTTRENIKSWWCGKDSDYNEIFKNNGKA
jgi:hypothetical protein